jgi:predicted secreted protein
MKALTALRNALPVLALSLLSASPALAATAERPTTVELAAEASRPAANDLARATVFAEATGATPGELGKRVNGLIADGLKMARSYGSVRVQSGATHTHPVYGKGNRIEGWRMRSDLTLESTDAAALSELLGKLQVSLGVANLSMLPAAETRRKAETEATIAALAAFRERARVIADALGKSFRIRHLSVSSSGRPPVMPVMRAAAMAADAAPPPMPLEAGESLVSSTVSGQIELIE